MKTIIKIFSLLIKRNTGYSPRTAIMLFSAFLGGLLVLCVITVLLIDVSLDGKIDSNMEDMGWLLFGAATLVTGGSIAKIAEYKSDMAKKKEEKKEDVNTNIKEEDIK